MTERQVYLDFNASTPIAREVVEVMRPFLGEHYGNPSSRRPCAAPSLRRRSW
jgi:cysteine desulfurase